MTYFFKSGNTFRIANKETVDMREKLPPGNYIVQYSELTGFYLEIAENFNIPEKLYGETKNQAERFLKAFEKRKKSTSVILVGEKGCGKTLLAQYISQVSKFPVLFINAPYSGDKFNTFLQQIEQPFILLFDEFEKVYSKDEDQNGLLTLLEGVYSTNSLNIFTSNNIHALNSFMKNRPGRARYLIDFKGLSPEFVREYSDDRLNNKAHVDALVQIAGTFESFNFDMMKALVEECNMFDEHPSQAITMLNIRPEFASRQSLRIEKLIADGVIIDKVNHTDRININPLTTNNFNIYFKTNEDDEDDGFDNEITFSRNNLKEITNEGSRFVYKMEDGDMVILVKVPETPYNAWEHCAF